MQSFSLFAVLGAVSLTLAGSVAGAGLEQIEHVVLFMQENRAFDHYFGTMAGVRGFQDPNVHISPNTGKDVFHQPVNASQLSGAQKPPANVTELLPWYLNAAGGDWVQATQCMVAGSNGWQQNHAAWNKGAQDQWVNANTPYSIGYYKRSDLPLHFALAEGWTVADSYYEAVIASTTPNRVSWASGSINVPGGPQTPDQGGPTVDNYESPGCEYASDGTPHSCYPLKWKTVAEYLQDANITWQVYQDRDNFDDNPFAWFDQFQKAKSDSQLAQRGVAFLGLDAFYKAAANGTLPQVSYIIGPTDLSEHPPYSPQDGAWFQRQIVSAVTQSPAYNKTALIVSYDETGGWGDHVISPFAPKGTPSQWMTDPFTPSLGTQPAGPGFRLPFYIISPWTRNGGVFTEPSSHESQIMFLERWSKAIGKPFMTSQIPDWRRQLSDLVNMFDFAHPDISSPDLPQVRKASQDALTGLYNGAAVCQAMHPKTQPPIPYGQQTEADALAVEKGYKPLRGNPTPGRYLTFEAQGHALTASHAAKLGAAAASADHSDAAQRFIIYPIEDTLTNNHFTIAHVGSGINTGSSFIDPSLKLGKRSSAATFAITDLGNGQGHSIVETSSGKSLSLDGGNPKLSKGQSAASSHFKLFAVSY